MFKRMIGLNFSITKHAKDRIIERALDKILKHHLYIVFKSGAKLTYDEVEHKLGNELIGLTGRTFTREYRKFDGLLYVFGGKTETTDSVLYRLITVIPIK